MPSRGGRPGTAELWFSVLLLTLAAGGGWIAAGFGLHAPLSRYLPIGALALTIAAAGYLIFLVRRMATIAQLATDDEPERNDRAATTEQRAPNDQPTTITQPTTTVQPAASASAAASVQPTTTEQPAADVPTSSTKPSTGNSAASAAESPPFLDELTKLPSRFWFEQTLRSEIARSRRYQHPLSLVVVAVDQYRQVNRDHGNAMSDYVLIAVSRALRSKVRLSDHIARMRGDEFVLMLPETNWAGAKVVGEKIRRAIELYPFDEDLAITVSVAVVGLADSDSSESIVLRGERGVVEARKRGGNRLVAVSLKNRE